MRPGGWLGAGFFKVKAVTVKICSQLLPLATPNRRIQPVLACGCAWVRRTPQFRVRLLSANETGARLSVCRYAVTIEANCGDGVDDDCDGLIDAADPDCKWVLPWAVSAC